LGADPTVQAHAQLAGRIEARISHLKRAFGLRRTRLRRLGGARTWVGLGIFAYNLQRMTMVAG
jgi:IS5 family transposase